MAAFEVIALDTATPQLRAPGASDTYTFPRAVEMPLGTANGVLYLNGSKVVTSGSGLVFAGANLGLGVTPSAWASGYIAFQTKGTTLGSNSSNGTYYTQNAFFDGTNWVYISNTAANRYQMLLGVHSWHIAPSGTAGNAISFTQAMTLDASGNLGVGSTAPVGYAGYVGATIQSTNGAFINLRNGANSNQMEIAVESGGTGYVKTILTAPLVFGTNNTERARIDSSGNLIQTVNTTAATLTTNGTLTFSIVDNSTLRISVRGSDGTTRTATVALT